LEEEQKTSLERAIDKTNQRLYQKGKQALKELKEFKMRNKTKKEVQGSNKT
jgi:DNA-binding ferritin-like protein